MNTQVSNLLKQSAGNNTRKLCCSVAGIGNDSRKCRAAIHAAIRTYNMTVSSQYQHQMHGAVKF